ncbi:hypothetical protein HJC23_001951 [Cyclotella cryptica]|uniref:PDZ domain-containing protein n=1 Tax=Cyclotella cryptica TaxID=29204 RepID=A0ABD3PN15_9STRA|eukprot:CCRYP_012913-RA/>CCRYP_012913-RA protein AED:0.15 eAED:0.15 QI:0/-1/0/1/-1/1/1/0/464
MDKFFGNLTGKKDDKKSSKTGDASWQGGRSDMDRIKNAGKSSDKNPSSSSNNSSNSNIPKNLLANANSALQNINLFQATPTKKGGQSLGGTQPGRLLSISLLHPGPLGIEIEKRRNATQSAIVSSVVPNSQADVAGLRRGDVLCRADDDAEFSYHDFLKLAKSNVRPLRFKVRRMDSSSSSSSSLSLQDGKGSVDALQRKQAVIAAAEAREARNKALWKKSASSTETDRSKQPPRINHADAADSALQNNTETLKAIEAVKAAEKTDVETLGYNPYEARAMTSGQARNATVKLTRGEMNAENAPPKIRGASVQSNNDAVAPGTVGAPVDPTVVVPSEFENAFSVLVTSSLDEKAVRKSLSTMRKLIHNAITKGQCNNSSNSSSNNNSNDEEASSKFRRVRLSNPKIKETITDMHGALELMMAVGFVLSENEADGETYLVFPPGEGQVQEWIQVALRRMEEYELGG